MPSLSCDCWNSLIWFSFYSSSPQMLLQKEILDPVSPLDWHMLHPMGWSRRGVRRMSYLSPCAEIGVIFLAESSGFKGCWKPSSSRGDLICSCEFIRFLQALQLFSMPATTPSLHFFCLWSHGWGAAADWECQQRTAGSDYVSSCSICVWLHFLFSLFCFGEKGKQDRQQKQTCCDTKLCDDVRDAAFVVTAVPEILWN